MRAKTALLFLCLAIFPSLNFVGPQSGAARWRVACRSAKDPYEILGVDPGSTESEIRAAYRQRARVDHPDISDAPNAEEIWLEVSEAYQVLTDPKRRQKKKGFKQGSTYVENERVQDDSELKAQFFEALGVMPSEQMPGFQLA